MLLKEFKVSHFLSRRLKASFSPATLFAPPGGLRGAPRPAGSLQRVLGLPRGLRPEGRAWNTAKCPKKAHVSRVHSRPCCHNVYRPVNRGLSNIIRLFPFFPSLFDKTPRHSNSLAQGSSSPNHPERASYREFPAVKFPPSWLTKHLRPSPNRWTRWLCGNNDSPDTREEHSELGKGFYSLWQLVEIRRRVRKVTVETDNQKSR